MKKLLQALFILALAFVSISEAQVTKTLIGSSYNIYSVISGSTNPLHANNDLGTISFTHRQNSNLVGGSGVIQTSWSTDGGETWEYVLQPTNDSTQFNRYPSGAIVDPIGNGLSSAHTVVAGPTTSSAASGWLANYFYNFALDGSGGREYNRAEPNNTADQAKLTRVGMMVDKNNIVRILGYFNTNLYITTGEFNPTGTNYYTDFVYASTASYYTGEYVDENGNVTTPAAWGPANGIQLGDTIFYMTSTNYDLFSDGSIDPTWTNEIEIISYYDNNGDSLSIPDTLNVWSNVANIQNEEGEWIPTTFPYDSFYVELNGVIDSTLIVGEPGYYWTENMITTSGLPDASTNDDTYTIYGYSMAFNQNGNIGYAVMLGDQENGLISPFVHKTVDGGLTWEEQSIDFSNIDGYNQPFFTGELDCTVDLNGSLHMMCVIEEGQNGTTAYTNANIYDVVVNIDNEVTTNWISNLNTSAISYDSPQALDGEIGWGHRLQASRNENGSKVFALWNDVNIEEFETDLLEFPDIFAIGIDIEENTTTGVKNFTKFTQYDGMNFWTFTSPITYDEGDTYHLPTTTSENGPTGLDPSEHYYVQGIEFNKDDFTLDLATLSVESVSSLPQVSAYPNPADKFVNLSLNIQSDGEVIISLLNALGQEVYYSNNKYKSGSHSINIDLNGLEAGIYFYKVESENFAKTDRLIVK
tara:strand:- start:636 stop:2726 length:2091 start_codon:yes stop_codon:yes gene_type:complete